MSNSFHCVKCIHHTLAILPTSHNFGFCLLINSEQITSRHGSLQNSSTQFKKKLRTSRIRKWRTCGCEFKNPETSLRTKLLNMQLRTCGCRLKKLKFGCGFADCGLKKKLAVPSTVYHPIKQQFHFCRKTLLPLIYKPVVRTRRK